MRRWVPHCVARHVGNGLIVVGGICTAALVIAIASWMVFGIGTAISSMDDKEPSPPPASTPYEKAIRVCGGDKGIDSFNDDGPGWSVDCVD